MNTSRRNFLKGLSAITAVAALPLSALMRPVPQIKHDSTDHRQKMEGFLAHKFGLQANLATSHPFKLVAPVI